MVHFMFMCIFHSTPIEKQDDQAAKALWDNANYEGLDYSSLSTVQYKRVELLLSGNCSTQCQGVSWAYMENSRKPRPWDPPVPHIPSMSRVTTHDKEHEEKLSKWLPAFIIDCGH